MPVSQLTQSRENVLRHNGGIFETLRVGYSNINENLYKRDQ